MSWVEKLKNRWGVKSGWQVLIILCTFALTGFSFLYIKPYLYGFFGIDKASAMWVRILAFFILGLPAYQVILLLWGTLLGQFQFFWNFEKRMLYRIIGKKIK